MNNRSFVQIFEEFLLIFKYDYVYYQIQDNRNQVKLKKIQQEIIQQPKYIPYIKRTTLQSYR